MGIVRCLPVIDSSDHLAMACANINFLDLDSAFGFKAESVIGDMDYDKTIDGLIHLSATPGHGALFNEDCLGQPVRVIA